jgi:hypothetical protein
MNNNNNKSFSVTFKLKVDKESTILSTYEGGHEQDIQELVTDLFFDIDDVEVNSIKVLEK